MSENYYKDIIWDGICGDIIKALDNGIYTGAVILTLSAIDAMACLNMPSDQKNRSGKNYIEWVNKYMKTDPNQQYQYEGKDVYGARCALVHRYSYRSDLSDNGKCKIFVYGGREDHIYTPPKNENQEDAVLISIGRFAKDFIDAVYTFLGDIAEDEDLKKRVDSRLPSLFRTGKESDLKDKYDNKGKP